MGLRLDPDAVMVTPWLRPGLPAAPMSCLGCSTSSKGRATKPLRLPGRPVSFRLSTSPLPTTFLAKDIKLLLRRM